MFLLPSVDDKVASNTIYIRQLRDIADLSTGSLGYEALLSADRNHHDSILILPKWFLRRPRHLRRLRRNGNVLIGCPVDSALSSETPAYLDGLIASSPQQLRYFIEEMPEIPSFLVNHGIDARIQYPQCQQERFAAGYFGTLANGLYLDELQQLVTAHHTQTETSELDWTAALADHNCHYLLRPPLPPGVFKPFLKGFTAAACGATVIASGRDPTTVQMLGEDYPFLVRDLSINGVREAIGFAADSFQGPEWVSARAIVASLRREYSPEHIASQLAVAVRHYF